VNTSEIGVRRRRGRKPPPRHDLPPTISASGWSPESTGRRLLRWGRLLTRAMTRSHSPPCWSVFLAPHRTW